MPTPTATMVQHVRLIQQRPACPAMTPYLDFTNDSIWTKTLGIFEGLLETNQALSVINDSAVEVSRLMLDGMADNNPTPYIGTFDRLKLEALTQIPLTFFGTCKQLKISGTWRQPSLTIDPPTDGTCPFNPPTNVAQLSSASLGVVTDSIAPTGWNIGRNLFVVHTHSACAESGRRYDNDPVNVGIGLDEDWELNIDLNDVNPSDTYLQLWFRLYIYNEPFNEFGLYVNHYRCAIGGLTEVRNIDFELTV